MDPFIAELSLKTSTLVVLSTLGLLVGIGAGIGAGYGIFYEKSPTDSRLPEWLLIVEGGKGNLEISETGNFTLNVDSVVQKAPAFTNVPDRIATLLDVETAFDFLASPIDVNGPEVEGGAVNVILGFRPTNSSRVLFLPLEMDNDPAILRNSVNFTGVVYEGWDGQADGVYNGEALSQLEIEDVNLFVLAGNAPPDVEI